MRRWYEVFHLYHPAAPYSVGPIRWAAFQLGEWLYRKSRRLERWAIDPEDDMPF